MKLAWVIYFLLVSTTAVTLTACEANNSGGSNSMDSSGATAAAQTAAAQRAAQPQQITCNLAYRPNSGSRITNQETIVIKNEQTDTQLTMGEFDFQVLFFDGSMGGERSLRLSVTPTNSTAELTAQLYQLPLNNGPINQFVGGHGFTGLTYVTDPVSQAELQFWCTAE